MKLWPVGGGPGVSLYTPGSAAAEGASLMRCSYCQRPLRLIDRRHPQRRQRGSSRYTFGPAHKLLLLLGAVLGFVLVTVLLSGSRF